jgi:hypothetical protein
VQGQSLCRRLLAVHSKIRLINWSQERTMTVRHQLIQLVVDRRPVETAFMMRTEAADVFENSDARSRRGTEATTIKAPIPHWQDI